MKGLIRTPAEPTARAHGPARPRIEYNSHSATARLVCPKAGPHAQDRTPGKRNDTARSGRRPAVAATPAPAPHACHTHRPLLVWLDGPGAGVRRAQGGCTRTHTLPTREGR